MAVSVSVFGSCLSGVVLIELRLVVTLFTVVASVENLISTLRFGTIR